MKKIRINELARELEVKPSVILDLLPELGVTEKKTHSSSIDEDVADQAPPAARGASERSSAATATESSPIATHGTRKSRCRPPAVETARRRSRRREDADAPAEAAAQSEPPRPSAHRCVRRCDRYGRRSRPAAAPRPPHAPACRVRRGPPRRRPRRGPAAPAVRLAAAPPASIRRGAAIQRRRSRCRRARAASAARPLILAPQPAAALQHRPSGRAAAPSAPAGQAAPVRASRLRRPTVARPPPLRVASRLAPAAPSGLPPACAPAARVRAERPAPADAQASPRPSQAPPRPWPDSRPRVRWCRRVPTWSPSSRRPRPAMPGQPAASAPGHAHASRRARSRASRFIAVRFVPASPMRRPDAGASAPACRRRGPADRGRMHPTSPRPASNRPPPPDRSTPPSPRRSRGRAVAQRDARSRRGSAVCAPASAADAESEPAADQPRNHHLRRHHGQGAVREARRQGQPGDQEAGRPQDLRHHQPDARRQAGRGAGARFRRLHATSSATKRKPCRRSSRPRSTTDLATRAARGHHHGPRRSRQDLAARRHPRGQRGRRAKPAASRSTSAPITSR